MVGANRTTPLHLTAPLGDIVTRAAAGERQTLDREQGQSWSI
jgi:hypothetical protein